jgi:hypothetical protein
MPDPIKNWLDLPGSLEANPGETVADWQTRIDAYATANPTLVTPLDAAAFEDLEDRLRQYADEIAAAQVSLGKTELAPVGVSVDTAVLANTETDVNTGVSGWELTVDTDGTAVEIMVTAASIQSTTTSLITVSLYCDGVLAGAFNYRATTASYPAPLLIRREHTPTAGSHTYEVRLKCAAAGTISINCNALYPAQLTCRSV